MKIKVIKDNAPELKDLLFSKDVVFVEQANAKALIDQKVFCRISGHIVKALVPACVPSPSSQVPEQLFNKLVQCYESCINMAITLNAKTIVIQSLGVGIKTTAVSETGEISNTGLWGNLFWTHANSSIAAKLAVENSCSTIPDDVIICFSVPEEFFDDWDSAMQF